MPFQLQPSTLIIVAAIVGAVTGVISLLLLIFSVGRRVGQLETKLEHLEQKVVGQREWGELGNKVETLYRVYVIDTLSRSASNADNTQPKRRR